MISRILSTPLSMAAGTLPAGKPRRVHPDVLASVLPGPGRERLAAGEVLAITTGQQPALFTGPLIIAILTLIVLLFLFGHLAIRVG